MPITTGGGVGFDAGRSFREGSAQMSQSVESMLAGERQNRQQALEQGTAMFDQLMKQAIASGNVEDFLGSQAGTSGMLGVQQAMSRAAGTKLSPRDAMNGAYVTASKYYANNPSLASQMDSVYRHVLLLSDGASKQEAPPETAETAKTPEAPADRSTPELASVDPEIKRYTNNYKSPGLAPITSPPSLAQVGTDRQEQFAAIRGEQPLATYPELEAKAGLNTPEFQDRRIRMIWEKDPSKTTDQIRAEAMQMYPELYDPATKQYVPPTPPRPANPTSAQYGVGGRTLPGSSTQAIDGGSTLSPRIGPGQENQSLMGIPKSPVSVGIPNLESSLSRTDLPKGKVPLETEKLATEIPQIEQKVMEKTKSQLAKPSYQKSDQHFADKLGIVRDSLSTITDKITQGVSISAEDQRKLAISSRDFSSLSEKLDNMPDAEARKMLSKYKAWYDKASFTDLGAAGLDKMADRELSAYVTRAQVNAAFLRTKAEAGSAEYKTMAEIMDKTMQALSREEENMSRIMTAEKKTRAQVMGTYPEMAKTLNLLTDMVFGQKIDIQLLRKRNFLELLQGVEKGSGSGEAYGTNVIGKPPQVKTQSELDAILKDAGY